MWVSDEVAIWPPCQTRNSDGQAKKSALRFVPRRPVWLLAGLLPLAFAAPSGVQAQSLNDFAILAGSTITNTGTTTINGSIGLSPGTVITGAGPGANNFVQTGGTIHVADGVAVQAKSDLTTAYNVLMGRPSQTLVGDLGNGRILTAGVYSYGSSAQLTGTLTLQGGANDVFIIQVGSSLTTASNSAIVLSGAVNPANVFFVVGSSATLGTSTAFLGQILALTSIGLDTSATIDCGAAWARNGAVTLDSNTINICTFSIPAGTIGATLGGGGTKNDRAVAAAIDNFGGPLPLGFQVLALLTPAELAAALAEMAGEVATGVAPSGTQAMNAFLDQASGDHGGAGTVHLADNKAPEQNTVSVMGYAEAQPTATSAFSAFDRPLAEALPQIGRWDLWAGAYGAIV